MKPYFVLSTLGRELQAAGKRVKQEPPFGTWYLRYRDAYGKKQRRRSKARNEAEALRLNLDAEAEEEGVRGGRVKRKPLSRMLWEELRQRYLDAHADARSQAPMKSQFKCWYDPEWKGRPVASIGPADCDALLAKARKAGQKPNTVRQLRTRGLLVFQYAIDKLEALEANPWAKVHAPKVPRKRPVFLRKEQVDALLLAAGTSRLLLLTAVLTGLRRGELGGLRWTDVDFSAGKYGRLHARRSWGHDTTKDSEERVIPLHPFLRQELLAAAKRAKGATHVFASPRHGGMRHDSWHVANVLRAVATKAGVTLPEGCTFHSLRKTFATHLYQRTGDMSVPQRLLGHSALSLTDTVYVGTDLDLMDDAVALLTFGAKAEVEQKTNIRAVGAPTPKRSPSKKGQR